MAQTIHETKVIEQESGYDVKADIWSLGITIIQIAHGKTPYEGQKPLKVLKSILNHDPPKLQPRFSEKLQDLVAKCLQKDPEHRSSADELIDHPVLHGSKTWSHPTDCTLKPLLGKGSERVRSAQTRPVEESEEWEFAFEDIHQLDEMSETELDKSLKELVDLTFTGENLELARQERRISQEGAMGVPGSPDNDFLLPPADLLAPERLPARQPERAPAVERAPPPPGSGTEAAAPAAVEALFPLQGKSVSMDAGAPAALKPLQGKSLSMEHLDSVSPNAHPTEGLSPITGENPNPVTRDPNP
ncbi:kinase-like domain-containing protein [Baffinella frigidus]|nr:kinase-like domain-containing protein [Cryptophyta sp. CCMP2293]